MKAEIGIMSTIIFSLLLCGTSAAHGGSHDGCDEDANKYCTEAEINGGRYVDCLLEHENKLSAGCMEVMQSVKEMMKDSKAPQRPCDNDLKKFCSDVRPGDGKKMNCLKTNAANLSKICKDDIKEMQGTRNGRQ